MPNDNLSVVSIITVNYNGRRFLDACFDSLLVVDYPRELLEIIMVDNGSEDDSVRYVNERFPSVKVLKNEKNNYSQANNLGIRSSRGKYVVFINNDVVVERDWLKELVRCAEADLLIGAIGSKILLKNGKVQSLGLTQFPNFYWGDIGFYVKDSDKFNASEELVAISGCAALYRKECLEAIGVFDEDFNMYLEDVDLGIRCRKNGWKLLICSASIIHHEFHGTIGAEENARRRQEANRLLLVAKHWPDKLVEAIWQGRKYFASMPGALRVQRDNELAEALSKAIVKLRKEHGDDKAEAIEKDIVLMQQKMVYEDNTNILEELSPADKEISRRDERIIQLSLALERQDALWTKQDALLTKRLNKEITKRDERILEISRILERKDAEIISKDESIKYIRRRVELLEEELRGITSFM